MHIISITILFLIAFIASFSFSEAQLPQQPVFSMQMQIFDDDYFIEKFTDGLEWPTTMTFIDGDILILEKHTGKVIRIQENGLRYTEPVLDVGVGFVGEAGMLGIESTDNYVYLYYTKSCNGCLLYTSDAADE